jgi:hypothetical protein
MIQRVHILKALDLTDLEDKINKFLGLTELEVVNVAITEIARERLIACIVLRGKDA